jgi:penicillin-binding protein-related factor A (putative recombinase)
LLTKPFDQWEIDDIEQLLVLGERQLFEFKASSAITKDDSFRNESSKDVSSFANSVGGYIIYGVAEDKQKRSFSLDQGVEIARFTKEWLEDIVLAGVKPRLSGLAIKAIYRTPSHALYAIKINEGTTAYQARDKKYYKRFNFKAEPMEDHEIKFLVGKIKEPMIGLLIYSRLLHRSNELHKYQLDLSLVNRGTVRAKDVKVVLDFPKIFVDRIGSRFTCRLDYLDEFRNIEYTSVEFFGPGNPIFPDDTLHLGSLGDFNITFKMDVGLYQRSREIENLDVRWTVYADDAAPVRGTCQFRTLHSF